MLQEIKPRSEARVLSVVIYAVMGWIVLIAVKPLLAALGSAGFTWLAARAATNSVQISRASESLACRISITDRRAMTSPLGAVEGIHRHL